MAINKFRYAPNKEMKQRKSDYSVLVNPRDPYLGELTGDFFIKLTLVWVDPVHILNLIFKTKYFSKLKTQTKTSVPF